MLRGYRTTLDCRCNRLRHGGQRCRRSGWVPPLDRAKASSYFAALLRDVLSDEALCTLARKPVIAVERDPRNPVNAVAAKLRDRIALEAVNADEFTIWMVHADAYKAQMIAALW